MNKLALAIVMTVLVVAMRLDAAGQCPGDLDGNNVVTIDEILTSVNSALNGCAAQDVSVCGGPVTSTPKICNLRFSPNPGHRLQGFTLEWSWSDLEGDIDLICYTLSSAGGFDPGSADFIPLESHCDRGSHLRLNFDGVGYANFTLPPQVLINGSFVSDVGHALGHKGVYVLSVFVIDGAAHISNTETTAVVRID